MSGIPPRQGAGTQTVDIRAQVAATHNPLFPFSSPNIDDRSTPESALSDDTFQTESPLGSESTIIPARHNEKGRTDSRDRGLTERVGSTAQINNSSREIKSQSQTVSRKRSRPGLQVVTNFSPAQPQTGQVVLNQVAAKHPEKARNRARSVVSQKGVKVLTSPLTYRDSASAISSLKDLIKRKPNINSQAINIKKTVVASNVKPEGPLTSRSSVIFGLRVPEHEASLHGDANYIQSAVTLCTPTTPKIVITPADDDQDLVDYFNNKANRAKKTEDSPTSVYSKSVSHYYKAGISKTTDPVPPIPQLYSLNESRRERRFSSESQQHILPESGDTPRPKSQGWWNLMLSPILSRAGTLKNQNARNGAVPPVPALPAEVRNPIPPQTPVTVMSPVTPRRLGLANMRTSTWSQWTEVDAEKGLSDDHTSDIESAAPVLPEHYSLSDTHTAPRYVHLTETRKGEGLAAEYYHACAVEQLTNVTYFECINHSCSEHLPVLHSVYDSHQEAGRGILPVTADNGDHDKQVAAVGSDQKMLGTGKFVGIKEVEHLPIPISHIPKPTDNAKGSSSPVGSDMDIDEIVSPNVRQANMATFSKAKAVNSREQSPAPARSTMKPKQENTKLNIEMPAINSHQPAVLSPGPISPEASRTLAPAGALPMAPLQSVPAETSVPLLAPVPQSRHALVPSFQPQPTIVHYPFGQTGPYTVMAPPVHALPTSQHTPFDDVTYPAEPGSTAAAAYTQPAVTSIHARGNSSRELNDAERQNAGIPAWSHGLSGIDSQVRVQNSSGHINPFFAEHERNDTDQNGIQKESPIKREKGLAKLKLLGKLLRFGRSKKEAKKDPKKDSKRKRRNIFIAVVLIIIILLCILFAILFTRGHGNANPIESQMLNLSGYPPMPTGISTVARPNLVASQNQCTRPTTMWSCALPKEDQAVVLPNDANQPNFRFQIRFRNGTVPANMTIPLSRRAADTSADDLFAPNPPAPNQLEQVFLGNTTDNVTAPFNGEATPFFITFMSTNSGQSAPTTGSKRVLTRQFDNDNPLNAIPAPPIGSDGTAAPASLLPTSPFPFSQPVRLYNRGLRDEHYGFYIYYDKSIFLSGISLTNNSSDDTTQLEAAADQNGGSTKEAANVRCTWAQTRFVVKMFTNPKFGASLLSSPPTNNTNSKQSNNSTTSATNFNRPGSFPYPTTISLDRHGGDINKKLIFCYGMDRGTIVANKKVLGLEARAFGGTIVNPAPTLVNQANSSFDSSLGGIDGGTGGCGCTWQNWT